MLAGGIIIPHPDTAAVNAVAATARLMKVKRLINLGVCMMTPCDEHKKRGNIGVSPPAGNQLAARLLSLERQQIKHRIID